MNTEKNEKVKCCTLCENCICERSCKRILPTTVMVTLYYDNVTVTKEEAKEKFKAIKESYNGFEAVILGNYMPLTKIQEEMHINYIK